MSFRQCGSLNTSWQSCPREFKFTTSSFTQVAYHRVVRVCWQDLTTGETVIILQVQESSHLNESLRTWTSLLALKGVCTLLRRNGLIDSLSAKRLSLISAPSSRVCLSAVEMSAPRSFPAKSIREKVTQKCPLFLSMIWKMAWLREEWVLAEVLPDVWHLRPVSISLMTSSMLVTSSSHSPTTWICCLPSSSTLSCFFQFRGQAPCSYKSQRR